jgi:hypothetical protein
VSGSGNWVVLHSGIRSREEHAFMAVVTPTHPVRWAPFNPLDVENERFAVGLSHMVTSNHDLVSDDSSHISCLLSTGHIQHLNPRYATARKPDRALRLYPVTGWRPVLGELLSLSKSHRGDLYSRAPSQEAINQAEFAIGVKVQARDAGADQRRCRSARIIDVGLRSPSSSFEDFSSFSGSGRPQTKRTSRSPCSGINSPYCVAR